MPKAIWNDAVLAESDATEVVEGNHYFPPASINREHFEDSQAFGVAAEVESQSGRQEQERVETERRADIGKSCLGLESLKQRHAGHEGRCCEDEQHSSRMFPRTDKLSPRQWSGAAKLRNARHLAVGSSGAALTVNCVIDAVVQCDLA